jgi:hypothetical protein
MSLMPDPPVMLKITQGQIIVNSAWVVAQADDMVVWELDLKSKYPDGYIIHSWGDADRDGDQEETIGVHLFAGPSTLRSDTRTTLPTMITATMPDGEHWNLISDWARYTVRLAYYRRPDAADEHPLAFIDLTEEETA